jgi:exosortase H (IPTLxxWG-CTERM-specific)
MTRALVSRRDHPVFAIILFVVLAFVFHAILSLPAVQTGFLDPYTSLVTSWSRAVLKVVHPEIRGMGNVIGDNRFSIRVLNVCNGTDLWILYAAAVIAFPASLLSKAVGLVVGLPLLSLVNLTRVIGLFLTGRYLPALFNTSHLFLWQVALILITAGIFALYLRWAYRQAGPTPSHG